MSPIYTDETKTLAEMRKYENNGYVCGECGGIISVCWGGTFGIQHFILRCLKDVNHSKIERKFELSPSNDPVMLSLTHAGNKRRMKLEKQNPNAVALRGLEHKVALTNEEANKILQAIWPNAPKAEMERAAMLCKSYQLNPLMKHIFLIPFNKGTDKETWATVMGINATRLLASRRGTFSYIDDTPRIMTDDEQKSRFGKIYPDRIYVIVKVRDPKTGAEAPGYGFWPANVKAYGEDKGNTPFNMASNRAERQALARLRPGEMPTDIDVVDENFVEAEGVRVVEDTGEIVEEQPAPEEVIPPPEEVVPETPPPPAPPVQKPTPRTTAPEKNEAKITKAQVDNLLYAAQNVKLTQTELGNIMANELKFKPMVRTLSDLKVWQYEELMSDLKKRTA